MGNGICSCSQVGCLSLLVVRLVDRLVEPVQWYGAYGVHQLTAGYRRDTVGQGGRTVVVGIKQYGDSVAQEPEGGGGIALCGHQRPSFFFILGNLRAEGDHIELAIEDRPQDASRLCLHNGVTV